MSLVSDEAAIHSGLRRMVVMVEVDFGVGGMAVSKQTGFQGRCFYFNWQGA
jgi:hypothetical protein